MVPAIFVYLERMPLTPNGKIDRKALPVPGRLRPELEKGYVAPRTALEESLAAIWAGVLGLERIGVHDNFFDLGGHSLKATQVISQARRVFKADLPLRSLFESPTVAGLAERVQSAMGMSAPGKAPALAPVPRGGNLRLSFAQERLWFLDRWNPGSAMYNIPIVLRMTGELRLEVLERSLREILERHEALRTTFEEEGGQPVQRIAEQRTAGTGVDRPGASGGRRARGGNRAADSGGIEARV